MTACGSRQSICPSSETHLSVSSGWTAMQDRAKPSTATKAFLTCSIISYVIALPLPAITSGWGFEAPGWRCLFGLGILLPHVWVANLTLLVAWHCLKNSDPRSHFLAALTLALSCTLFLFDPLPGGMRLHAGALFWYSSILIALIGSATTGERVSGFRSWLLEGDWFLKDPRDSAPLSK
jgi:hypothetical protein